MTTLRSYLLGACALIALGGALAWVFSQGIIGAATSNAADSSSVPTTPVTGQPIPAAQFDKDDSDMTSTTPQTGAAAIRRTIEGAGPNSPSFTEKDVREYVDRARTTGFGKIGIASGEAQIESIRFLTRAQLKAQTSKPIADMEVSDDTLLCYVEYNGNFVVFGPYGNGSVPVYLNHMAQVYDAHTGNFLAQTAYNQK